MKGYRYYLFDFDLTLADSSRGIVMCFTHVLHRHGYLQVTEMQIKRTIGKTLEESFSILTGITDAEQLAALKLEYTHEADIYMNDNTVLFPETVSVLTQLKQQGAKVAIISTKYRYRIEGVMQRYFPHGFIDLIIGGEDVKVAKPHPQGVTAALERLQAPKEEALYVGDSTVDAETARNAGVDFCGVLNGLTTREELAAYPHRYIFDNLTPITSLTQRTMKIIDDQLMNSVVEQAKQSPRLRMNYNFHQSLEDKCHRFLNAMEPGTQVAVHHHITKDETVVVLRGKIKVLIYNDQGEVTESVIIDPKAGRFGVDIPKNTWHTVECLESGTVVFEVKEGPFVTHEVDGILEVKK